MALRSDARIAAILRDPEQAKKFHDFFHEDVAAAFGGNIKPRVSEQFEYHDGEGNLHKVRLRKRSLFGGLDKPETLER